MKLQALIELDSVDQKKRLSTGKIIERDNLGLPMIVFLSAPSVKALYCKTALAKVLRCMEATQIAQASSTVNMSDNRPCDYKASE